MADKEIPFKYLSQEEFLALRADARAEYLKQVTDYLARRVELLAKRQEPES